MYPRIFLGFSWGTYGHVIHLNQLRVKIWLIIITLPKPKQIFIKKSYFLLRQTEQKGSVSGEVRIFPADFAVKHCRENGVSTRQFSFPLEVLECQFLSQPCLTRIFGDEQVTNLCPVSLRLKHRTRERNERRETIRWGMNSDIYLSTDSNSKLTILNTDDTTSYGADVSPNTLEFLVNKDLAPKKPSQC